MWLVICGKSALEYLLRCLIFRVNCLENSTRIREFSKPCYVDSTLIGNNFAVNRALIKSWEHSPDLLRNVFILTTVKTYAWNCSNCISALIVISFFFRRPTISSGLHPRGRILINTFCTNQRYPSCKCFWPAVLRFASFSLAGEICFVVSLFIFLDWLSLINDFYWISLYFVQYDFNRLNMPKLGLDYV